MFARLCRWIGHRREGQIAKPLAGTWVSTCRRCGAHLVRIKHGYWVPPARLKAPYQSALMQAALRERDKAEKSFRPAMRWLPPAEDTAGDGARDQRVRSDRAG